MKKLITIRKQNENGSLGITLPASIVRDVKLKPGKYIIEHKKNASSERVLEINLKSIYED